MSVYEFARVKKNKINVKIKEDSPNNLNTLKVFVNPEKILERIIGFGSYFAFIFNHQLDNYVVVTNSFKKVLGYNLSILEEKGNNFKNSIIHPADLPRVHKILSEFSQTLRATDHDQHQGLLMSYVYRVKSAHDGYIWLMEQTQPLLTDADGNLLFSVSICTDISKHDVEKKVEMKLEVLEEKNSLRIFAKEAANGLEEIDFTPRERELLTYLAKGMSSKEIAEALNISVHTVNKHRKNMLNKLNFKKTAELIKFATIRGVIR